MAWLLLYYVLYISSLPLQPLVGVFLEGGISYFSSNSRTFLSFFSRFSLVKISLFKKIMKNETRSTDQWCLIRLEHTHTHIVSTTLPNIYKIEREIENMKPSALAQQHYI